MEEREKAKVEEDEDKTFHSLSEETLSTPPELIPEFLRQQLIEREARVTTFDSYDLYQLTMNEVTWLQCYTPQHYHYTFVGQMAKRKVSRSKESRSSEEKR